VQRSEPWQISACPAQICGTSWSHGQASTADSAPRLHVRRLAQPRAAGRHRVSPAGVKRILNDHGIEPAPERGQRTPWKTFLAAHWDAIAAADFFTFLLGVRHLILDRDPLYTERFVLSIKSECLERMVPLGERHLRLAVTEYAEHYHVERPHQGLGNRLIGQAPAEPSSTGEVKRRDRLGGVLSFYYREAA